MREKEKRETSKGSQTEAKTYALKLLSYRSRSRKELHDRLTGRGFTREQVDSTILSLERAGLINDEDLAAELLRFLSDRKSLGMPGIRAFLARRGIEKDLIQKTLTSYSREMEEESARRFVEKKLKALKNYPQDIIVRRLHMMLQRRGFSSEIIRRVMKSSL